ncbi:hypothetical protein OH77DRAFT_1462968 [Trametes cingulata]|nr:hypothetical protein OH77DRAFT_1462968 [Trametes cingulata]
MRESDVVYYASIAHRQTIHSLASSVWLLYDLLTTFDQEVEFVRRSANTLPKTLYLISRYVGLFGQFVSATNLLPMFCFSSLMASLTLLVCLIFSIEVSLMLRIDALYGRSRTVRALLAVAFTAEVAVAAAINGITYPRVYTELRPFPPDWPFEGCFYPTDSYLYKFCWIPILAFESVLFCLNVAKCISYGPLDHTPLIYRLFRDGSVYFAIAFAFMLVCTISQFLDFSSLSSVASTWISAVFSYAGCHLLLSVRKVAAQRERLDLTLLSIHASAVHDEAKSETYLDSPDSLEPPRISSRQRTDSIELVPRHISHHLDFVGLHNGDASSAQRTESSDWSKRRRSESQSDSVSTAWVHGSQP